MDDAGPRPTPALLGRTFAYLYGAGGLLAFATLLFPHGAGRDDAAIAAAAAVALLMAGAITFFWERLPADSFRWLPVFGSALVTLVVNSADRGAVIPYSAFFFWVVLSAFYLFDVRWAWFNVALVGLALGVTLATFEGVRDRGVAWIMLMGALSVGGAVTSLLRSRLEQMIAESHASLERAQSSEHALAEAQRIAQIGSWEIDIATRRFTGSAQLFRMLGLGEGSLGTLDEVLAALGPAERGRITDHVREALRDKSRIEIEYEIRLAGGERRIMHTRGRVIDEAGAVAKVVGTTEDVTERRAQEADLQRTLRRLRATIDIGLALGQEREPSGLLRLVSEQAQSLLDARSVFVVLSDDREGEPITAAGESPPPATVVGEGEALRAPLTYRGVTHGVLIALPSAERARFSREDEDMLRAFASSAATAVAGAKMVQEDALRRSIEASERERRRLARELHDQTLQALAVLRMSLEGALASGPTALDVAADTALRVISDEVENLRRIIADLRPALLDELGLAPALEAMAERVRTEFGLQLEVDVDIAAERLASEVEWTIFRVVQECLTNICKHAQATHARIEVFDVAGDVHVRVADDGVGFDPADARGFGLAGMRERLSLIAGTLTVESGGGGTTVAATIPAAVADA